MAGYLRISQLRDERSRIPDARELPRLPARMTAAANRAHAAGPIDDEEFSEILPGGAALATAPEDAIKQRRALHSYERVDGEGEAEFDATIAARRVTGSAP
jgi:hypothetical protein